MVQQNFSVLRFLDHRVLNQGMDAVVRPSAKELTERELEVMHLFWMHGPATAQTTRDRMAEAGLDLAYVTVANLVRLLVEKDFLEAVNSERPFIYQPVRSFNDVSQSLIGELVQRVFHGSREQLLVQMLGGDQRLSLQERSFLEEILKEQEYSFAGAVGDTTEHTLAKRPKSSVRPQFFE